MAGPIRLYSVVFVYKPANNEISRLYIINGSDEKLSFCIRHLSASINKNEEVIIGKTVFGSYYQLYLEKYKGGSQYIREDAASVNKFMNTARIGTALAKYISEMNLWKQIKD